MDNGWEDLGTEENEKRSKKEYFFAKIFLGFLVLFGIFVAVGLVIK